MDSSSKFAQRIHTMAGSAEVVRGLFNSLPNIKDRTARLKPIRGLMPDPSNLPKGCAFADRCDYATDKCREAKPPKKMLSDTHFVACCLYEDGKDEDRL